jgi:hypothetical protein
MTACLQARAESQATVVCAGWTGLHTAVPSNVQFTGIQCKETLFDTGAQSDYGFAKFYILDTCIYVSDISL